MLYGFVCSLMCRRLSVTTNVVGIILDILQVELVYLCVFPLIGLVSQYPCVFRINSEMVLVGRRTAKEDLRRNNVCVSDGHCVWNGCTVSGRPPPTKHHVDSKSPSATHEMLGSTAQRLNCSQAFCRLIGQVFGDGLPGLSGLTLYMSCVP